MKNIINYFKKINKSFILFIALIVILPFFFNRPMNMRILIEIGILSIAVLGLNLLMGLAGQVSMGHAGIFGLSAYITGLLSSGKLPFITLPVYITIPIAVVFSTILCYLIAIPILKLKGHYLAMGTLSLGIIFFTLFVNFPNAGGFDGFSEIPRLWLFGESFTKEVLNLTKYLNGYILVYLVLFVLLIFSHNLNRSKIGRAFKAIHTSEIAAQSLGINVARYKVLVFTISGFYASIAGVLFAHFYCSVTPGDFSIVKSITLVTMVVIGGTSSIWGSVIGTAFLVLISYLLETLQDVLTGLNITISFMDYNIFIYGLLFLIALVFLPDGLIGLKAKVEKLIKGKKNG